jgi:hypothetical protein
LAAKDASTRRGVYTDANPYQYGQYRPAIPVATPVDDFNKDVGSRLNSGLGGNRLLRNSNVNPSAAARMAHARSFRKKKGGSMRPLGGSIRPL